AKGANLLGIRAVVAQSFERIHRANLVGMGVLPLQFRDGEDAASHGLDGTEVIAITGLDDGRAKTATVLATRAHGSQVRFDVHVMRLTPEEVEYFRHGGLLHYVLRQLASRPYRRRITTGETPARPGAARRTRQDQSVIPAKAGIHGRSVI